MLKQANPEFGCQKISDLLLRGPALPASPAAVARVLHEAGYQLEEVTTRPHPDRVRSFERTWPNQLWQTDLFTFVLKRQNRRVYLVAFMDDHSRFLVGYGLHASQSSALVLEVLRAALANYGPPEEILTDNGSQYVTWRGKSAFAKELEKRGIRQVVAAPRRPQTLGKIERFWGTLWRECVEAAVFMDLGDAQRRIGLFIDHYNFQRPHQGIDGLVPADRFFGAAPDVLRTLKERVAANALHLARHGVPREPFYLTGQVAGQPFSVHAEGERVILTGADGRREVDLVPPAAAAAELPPPVCPVGVVSCHAGRGGRHQRRAAGPGHVAAGQRVTACAAGARRWPVTSHSATVVPPGAAARTAGPKPARPGRPRAADRRCQCRGAAAGGRHPGSAGGGTDPDRGGRSTGHLADSLLHHRSRALAGADRRLRAAAARRWYGRQPANWPRYDGSVSSCDARRRGSRRCCV